LRAHIAERGPFPPAEARDLLAQIAEALAAVHAAGIVHRDVKASNVLLTEDGVAKLTDFGIARGRDPKGSTRAGSLLGTPAYMAPEGPVDARSDLYSLGVLYYELLSGALPFTSTNYHEVIRAHVETKPDLTRLPSSERGLTGWLMSKNPSERPRSAAILLAALRSAGTGARTPADNRSTSSPSPTGTLDHGVAATRGGSSTRSTTHTPTPTPTPTPATASSGRSYRSTLWPTPRPQRSRGDRQAVNAALAVGLMSLVAIAAVVFLAAGSSGPGPTPGPVEPLTAPASGGSGGSLALVAVAFLAIGAIAIAATLAMSRARSVAARDRDSIGFRR
jgi:serine/threonine-protein kinase